MLSDLALEASESPTKIAHGLLCALLILDERKPHKAFSATTEPDPRRHCDIRFLD